MADFGIRRGLVIDESIEDFLNISCIYKIINPSNKIYIGQTINLKKRIDKYNRLNCKCQSRLYNSFKKYGLENHKIYLVTKCDIDKMNETERYYQEFYDVIGKSGLNCKLTSTKDKKLIHSEETRKKMSEKSKGRKDAKEEIERKRLFQTGRKMPREGVLKSVEKRKGFKHSEKTKQKLREISLRDRDKISNRMKGKKLSEETKLKISISQKGKKRNYSFYKDKNILRKRVLSNPQTKLVVNLESGIFYDCTRDSSIAYGVNYSYLIQQLNGSKKNKTSLMYI